MDNLIEMLVGFRKTGDPALAEKIMSAVLADVHLFVFTKIPKEDVDDVRQDALFAIALALYSFRGESRPEFFAYCYRITRATIAKYYRKRSREPQTHPNFEALLALIDKKAADTRSTEAEIREEREAVELLKKTDPECFEILYSRHILGLRLKEIGEDLGISENAARMRVNRCEESYLKG
jgi:RNA polymerase sigma factor (sigma-70 family)